MLTTSHPRCWIYHELSKHPESLEKVRQEHDSVFGTNLHQTRQVVRDTPSRLNQLPYTTAVIKETLRLHNIAATFRAGSPGFHLALEGRSYPTYDTMVGTLPSAMQLRDDLWPRAREFVPERFLAADGDPMQPPKNAWRPFELGTTRCIGQELAMQEMKVAMILTLRELDIKTDLEGWMQRQNEGGKVVDKSQPLDAVDGDPIYRTGIGIGQVKENLPVRVAFREK